MHTCQLLYGKISYETESESANRVLQTALAGGAQIDDAQACNINEDLSCEYGVMLESMHGLLPVCISGICHT